MTARKRTKYAGVYERASETRTHNGKPDICFDISYKSDGKKFWEKAGWVSEGYTAKLASEIRAERLRSIRHGDELPKQKKKAPFFKDLAAKYVEWAKENKARAGIEDKRLYDKHLSRRFDDKRLDEISAFDLERVKSELSKEGLAPATVKHCLVLVRQMYNKAVSWGTWKGENPTRGVRMPTLNNQRERFLSYEEADKLLTKLTQVSKHTHDMALISLHCGLRADEIFSLKAQDLDFENGLINIADPKNKKSRKAFMTDQVRAALQNRVPDDPEDLVFKDRWHGGKINKISHTFWRAIKELGFNNGITDSRQKVCFHSLRHTFASWLALQGETQLTIKELLGHKSLAMTERYSHLIPDHKRRATLQLEKAFEQKRNGKDKAEVVSMHDKERD